MKDIFKYFTISVKISEGKIFVIFLLAFFAALSQLGSITSLILTLNTTLSEKQIPIKSLEFISKMDYIQEMSQTQKISLLLMSTAILFLLGGIIQFVDEWYKNRILAKLMMKMQIEYIELISNLDFETFISYNLGKISLHFGQITILVQSIRFFTNFICSIIFSLNGLILPLLINYKLTITILLIFFPFILIIKKTNKKIRELTADQISVGTKFSNMFLQFLINFKYLKITAGYKKISKNYNKILKHITHLAVKYGFVGAITPHLIPPVLVIIVCFFIYAQVALFNMPLLEVYTMLGLIYHFIQKSLSIPNTYQKFISSAVNIDSYLDFIKQVKINQEHPTNGNKIPRHPYSIKIQNLSFFYKSRDKKVIDNLSLYIPQNSMIALVGMSGSGKSTLVNIIAGLLKPSIGELFVNDIPYHDINMEEFRKSISYVIQEPVVFNDTILNNITTWDLSPNMEKVKLITKQVSLDKVIEELPEKYETVLGFSGINLSGGQCQRLAIARELYKNSSILILDEATSALDSETESIIYETIKKVKGEKIIIIIAHRLATVKDCDKIFVLDNGRIIEEGTFEELIKKNGKFKQMVDKQVL